MHRQRWEASTLVKEFSCGDVVPGCTATFTAPSDNDILSLVAALAIDDHGMASVPPELASQVRSHIKG